MILGEVKKHKRNLFVMWFDYKKAFDSVPHNWKLKAQLDNWQKYLHGAKETITTDNIKYLTGLLQGECLSLILFIISVNPLSYLLQKLPGYSVGPPSRRVSVISHLFFVDDLKTYAKDIDEAKIQADMITQFTNDINMEFGTNNTHTYILKMEKERH